MRSNVRVRNLRCLRIQVCPRMPEIHPAVGKRRCCFKNRPSPSLIPCERSHARAVNHGRGVLLPQFLPPSLIRCPPLDIRHVDTNLWDQWTLSGGQGAIDPPPLLVCFIHHTSNHSSTHWHSHLNTHARTHTHTHLSSSTLPHIHPSMHPSCHHPSISNPLHTLSILHLSVSWGGWAIHSTTHPPHPTLHPPPLATEPALHSSLIAVISLETSSAFTTFNTIK